MAIYRKGEDQFGLWQRAKQQEATHSMSKADQGGYIAGLNPEMSVKEYEGMGGGPISAKGMRMGAEAKHWLKDRKK